MKKKFMISGVIFTILAIISIVCLGRYKSATNEQPTSHYSNLINVGGHPIYVDISRSPAEMEQGLSGRTFMAANQGMLFDFGTGNSQLPTFWMKDMNFGLDFIWINNHEVVEITPNVPAPKNKTDQLQLYRPSSPVDEVLEVNAGWAEKNNIGIRDLVRE